LFENTGSFWTAWPNGLPSK